MVFRIEPTAKSDIQINITYYNKIQDGLGKKFHAEIKRNFNAIAKNPYYQIRYDDVRCLPLKKFPLMIHFTVDEIIQVIIIRAVINTSKNPETTWL